MFFSYCKQLKQVELRATELLNLFPQFLRNKQVRTSCSTYNTQNKVTTYSAANADLAALEGSSSSSCHFLSSNRDSVPAGQLLLLVFWSQLEKLKHEFSSSTCQKHKVPLQVHGSLFKHCFTGQIPFRKGETQAEKRYTASVSNIKEHLFTNHTRKMCCLLNFCFNSWPLHFLQ